MPQVRIIGTGTGATAVATVSNGIVTQITITATGTGYSSTNTTIRIASPPFMPWLEVGVRKVAVKQHVNIGKNSILESSTDLKIWNQIGLQFTAEDEMIIQEFDVGVTGRFFRIREVP